MEQQELNILQILSDNPDLSQRQIAKESGLSIGMVNNLIKKCVKTGLIKIENLNARSMRYILTPKGIEEKTKKTLSYIARSYRAIRVIDDQIRAQTEQYMQEGKKILIYGPRDELFHIVTQSLRDMAIPYQIVQDEVHLSQITSETPDDYVVYLWATGYEVAGVKHWKVI